MSTSTWLPVLFTLLTALGISYFLGLIPGAKSSVTAAATTTAADADTHVVPNVEGEKTYTQNGQNGTTSQAAEVEIDKRLPPVQHQCLACDKKSEQLGKPLLRCSQCKNAFYCNETCQKAEWKRHKFNCSLFPPEGLRPAHIPITQSLVEEVRRVDEMLKVWLDKISELTNGLKENVEKVNGADLPEALPICQLKLSPEFEYKDLPKLQLERHPFRNPLIQICRLYLIALVASHPNLEHRQLLANKITSISLPSHLGTLYGPKIVSRPAGLSAGEYDAFAEVAPAIMVEPEKVGMDEFERGRWIALAVGLKKLWNAGLAPKSTTTNVSS